MMNIIMDVIRIGGRMEINLGKNIYFEHLDGSIGNYSLESGG